MKTKQLLLFFLFAVSLFSCKKESTQAENEKNIKKQWGLDQYLVNGVDKTGSLVISSYSESYTDNSKYDRSFTDKNGSKITQNGSFSFESAQQLHISGVGSIEFSNNNTISSSHYNILKLTDTQLWYSFTNGGDSHELRLSRK